MSIATTVARDKAEHPERYCPHPGCLWRVLNVRTGARTPCRRHPSKEPQRDS